MTNPRGGVVKSDKGGYDPTPRVPKGFLLKKKRASGFPPGRAFFVTACEAAQSQSETPRRIASGMRVFEKTGSSASARRAR
ncbi:hypothetical protein SUTMEG_08360 [Sutterella megalosphaeroides]|uniref:Uncharacterized protein n=1 Tax=Sutterella megalosphaeroides TaxID=2494234 RepID=A0A2Z6I8Z7_9BURK|nr:hypothetical protein SUTMEG_08360 [Sutterella megalosphaeroides]